MKNIFLIPILFLSLTAFAQQVNGVIYYQNSGGKTAANVQVSAFGCSSVESASNGMFILSCPGKKAGQKLKLIIGSTDGEGKGIEVVNNRQLEWLRLPDDILNADPIEIIICYAGQRDEAALRFHGILVKANNKEYDRQLSEFEAQLQQNTLSANERRILIEQIDELKAEKDAAHEKLEEQAQFIASINQDQASDLVKSAIQMIEQEENVDAAIAILDDAKLEEAYQLALEKILRGEAEVRQVIEGYELKISLLLPKFKYAEVTKYYEKIIEIHKSNQFDKIELATWYAKAASVIYDNGRYEKALAYQQKDISIIEEILDPKHSSLATSYNNIALTYEALGQYEKALAYQQKSISIWEEILDPKHPSLATSYNNIALTYEALGQYEKALAYQQKSISIREEILDPKHPDLAISYNNIGNTYKALGQYEKALAYHQKDISIIEEILDPKHPSLATSYDNIGNTYQVLGQYEKALAYQQKSISVREEILDPKHPSLATSYNNIALTYKALGQYEKALEYQQKDISIIEKILDPKHPYLATSYGNIGSTYKALGQNEKALAYQQKDISIIEKILDPKHPDLATSYNNIALTYQAMGQNEKALGYQQKSISIWEEILDPKHPSLATSYNNIALTYKALGRYEKALAYQEKCLAIFAVALPENHPYLQQALTTWLEIYYDRALDAFKTKSYVAALQDFDTLNTYITHEEIWNYTGLCHYYLSDYPKAIEAYQKAVDISPELKKTSFYNNIGMAYAKNQQFEEAHAAFTEYEKLFPKEGRPYRNWAMYYALQDEKEKALSHLQKAVKLGYDDMEWLRTDDSLKELRKEKAFIEIIEKLEKDRGK